jgi:hypothetical protein
VNEYAFTGVTEEGDHASQKFFPQFPDMHSVLLTSLVQSKDEPKGLETFASLNVSHPEVNLLSKIKLLKSVVFSLAGCNNV